MFVVKSPPCSTTGQRGIKLITSVRASTWPVCGWGSGVTITTLPYAGVSPVQSSFCFVALSLRFSVFSFSVSTDNNYTGKHARNHMMLSCVCVGEIKGHRTPEGVGTPGVRAPQVSVCAIPTQNVLNTYCAPRIKSFSYVSEGGPM